MKAGPDLLLGTLVEVVNTKKVSALGSHPERC